MFCSSKIENSIMHFSLFFLVLCCSQYHQNGVPWAEEEEGAEFMPRRHASTSNVNEIDDDFGES